MKKTTVPSFAAAAVCIMSPVQAGDSSKGVVEVVAPPAPECSDRVVQPLFSRYASVSDQWTLRAGYRSFRGAQLQEVDSFDGDSYDIELTVPLSDRYQLRFYYPIHTDGDAELIETGDAVDVDGNGGTLDFPSLFIDYQFQKANSPEEFNLTVYLGVGYVNDHLEGKVRKSGDIDRINHRGSALMLGLRADRQLNNCWSFVGNVGVRYYWESDDINPGGGSDKFFLLDASAAWIYAPHGAWAYPGVELVYQSNFGDYNSVQVVPQVIVPLGSQIDLNMGVAVGVADGPDTEARVQLNFSF